MSDGLDLTCDLLAHTPNTAAVGVLLRGLDSSSREAPERAFKALLARWTAEGAAAVLSRWHTLPEHWKLLVRDKPDWLTPAIRSAVFGYDEQRYRNGCDAALITHEYDLAPVLVGAAEDQANPFAALAAETTLLLAEQLHDETHTPRDYRDRRDPALRRAYFLAALEKSVDGFVRHGSRELLEAFLLLAGRENPLLRHILQTPHEREYPPLAEVLVTSSRPGVIRLLLQFLDDPSAPAGALTLLGRRRDLTFLRQLFRKIGVEPSTPVLANLRRIDTIAWLRLADRLLPALAEAEQAGAVPLVLASHAPREQVLEFLEPWLLRGEPAARRAAAAALASLTLPPRATLVQKALLDADPQVRANLAPLLRKCGVSDAVPKLLAMLHSPFAEERAAARRSLHEFEFSRFLAVFDDLDAAARIATGRLVRQVDSDAIPAVAQELRAESRTRRRRGLDLAVALAAVSDLAEEIGGLFSEEDPYLRVEAVRTLASDDSPAIRKLLRDALLDPHPLVHQAAEETLARRTRTAAIGLTQPAPAVLPTVPGACP